MRFLLRLAFWLVVVAILLPGGTHSTPTTQISASEAVSAAKATVGDVRQFCGRQPDACTVGSQAAVVLGDRAKAGARRIYEFLNKEMGHHGDDAVATASAGSRPVPLPSPRPSQHTLRPADLVPAWRAPIPAGDHAA